MSEPCCGATCELPKDGAHTRHWGLSRQAVLMSVAGVLIGTGLAASYAGASETAVAALCAAAAALTIGTPLKRAVTSLRKRLLDINVLMVIAVAGAAALGDWIGRHGRVVVRHRSVARDVEHGARGPRDPIPCRTRAGGRDNSPSRR